MPLSKEHKAQSREKILDAAAHLFRKEGYNGVAVEAIMAEAGMTRGGFYAHFPSKSALFAEVLGSKHDLIRRLRERNGQTNAELRQQAADIFSQYLSPDNFPLVAPNCTLSTLNMDAVRSTEEAQNAYAEAILQLFGEIEAGRDIHTPSAQQYLSSSNVAALAIGALSLARNSGDEKTRRTILNFARKQIEQWLCVDGNMT